MKRSLINVAVALITLALGLWVASLTHSMFGREECIEIPQQELLSVPSCVEERTPDEFSAFWGEFQSAVHEEDKRKLFSMLRKCSFDWAPLEGFNLVKPLEHDSYRAPSQLETPFEVKPTVLHNWGQDLRFISYDAFLANYDIIFSQSMRLRLLRTEPDGPSAGCDRAIIWRGERLNRLCFDRDATGFKFSGLRGEP